MQGKGIVKFFLVIMVIVCAIQYLLILPTRKVERSADAYAEKVAMSLGIKCRPQCRDTRTMSALSRAR